MTLDQAIAFAGNQSSTSLSAPFFDKLAMDRVTPMSEYVRINAKTQADSLQESALSREQPYPAMFIRVLNILRMVNSNTWITETIPGLNLSLISPPATLDKNLAAFNNHMTYFSKIGGNVFATAVTNAAMLASLSLGKPSSKYYDSGGQVIQGFEIINTFNNFMRYTLKMQMSLIKLYLGYWLNAKVSEKPTVNFSYTVSGNTVNFTGTYSSPYNIHNFTWHFGDGSVDTGHQNVSHTYQSQGTYTVKFTVIPDYGASNFIEKQVSLSFLTQQERYAIAKEWEVSLQGGRKYDTNQYVSQVDYYRTGTINTVVPQAYETRTQVINALDTEFQKQIRLSIRNTLITAINQGTLVKGIITQDIYNAFNSTSTVEALTSAINTLIANAQSIIDQEQQRINQLIQNFVNTWTPVVGQQLVISAVSNVTNRGLNYDQTKAILDPYIRNFTGRSIAIQIAGIDGEATNYYNKLIAQHNIDTEQVPNKHEKRISTIIIRAKQQFGIYQADMSNFPLLTNAQIESYRQWLINKINEVIESIVNPVYTEQQRRIILLEYYNNFVSKYNLMAISSLPAEYGRDENAKRMAACDWLTNLIYTLAAENTTTSNMIAKYNQQAESYMNNWDIEYQRLMIANEYIQKWSGGQYVITNIKALVQQALNEIKGIAGLRERIEDIINKWLADNTAMGKKAMMDLFINAVKSIIGEDLARKMADSAMYAAGDNYKNRFDTEVGNLFWPEWEEMKSTTNNKVSDIINEFYRISTSEGYSGLKTLVDQAVKNTGILAIVYPPTNFWVFPSTVEGWLGYFRSAINSEGFRQELYKLYGEYKKAHPIIPPSTWENDLAKMAEEFRQQYQGIDGLPAINALMDNYFKTANIATEQIYNNLGKALGVKGLLEDKLRGYIAGRRLEIKNKALAQYGAKIGIERCKGLIDGVFAKFPVFTPLSEVENEVVKVLNANSGIEERPTSSFLASIDNGIAPLIINFTNKSSGNITSYKWDFGDLTTSIEKSPSHTFMNAKDYTVKLTVTGPGGTHDSSVIIRVSSPVVPPVVPPVEPPVEPPVVPPVEPPVEPPYITAPSNYVISIFGVSILTGNAPLEVIFSDWSIGAVTNYKWDFGDGATSTEQNPTHIYQVAGVYTVSYIVSNLTNSDTSYETIIVAEGGQVEIENAIARFTAKPMIGNAPLDVQFTDESVGTITSYKWDFGDTATSAEQNPIHRYETADVYEAKLSISGPDGSDSVTKKITVTKDGEIVIVVKKKEEKKSNIGWILAGLAGLIIMTTGEENKK